MLRVTIYISSPSKHVAKFKDRWEKQMVDSLLDAALSEMPQKDSSSSQGDSTLKQKWFDQLF